MRRITDRHGAHCLQLSKLSKSERLNTGNPANAAPCPLDG